MIVQGHDLVGDIHGHADALHRLLHELDYAEVEGIFQHPERQMIFVGDFIDLGLQQREVLRIARSMCEAGAARAVMGNHDFNASGWVGGHEGGRRVPAKSFGKEWEPAAARLSKHATHADRRKKARSCIWRAVLKRDACVANAARIAEIRSSSASVSRTVTSEQNALTDLSNNPLPDGSHRGPTLWERNSKFLRDNEQVRC